MIVKDYIIERLQQQYSFDESIDLESLNFVEKGYVDSMGFVMFVSEIEEKYNIVFTNEEIISDDFQVVGKLIKMIENKLLRK